MRTLVDSHCHLNFPEFSGRLDDVINNAAQNSVRYAVTINTCLTQTDDLIAIADRYPNVFCTVGVHPNEAHKHADLITNGGLFSVLQNYTNHSKMIGLGETGLDYHYETSPRDLQKKSFAQHLHASEQLGLPVVIHTRDADADTLDLVRQYPNATGVFHCFSGDWALAEAALELGYYISFSGIITFKTAETLRQVARQVPLDRVLVETDSPYLAPMPFRGKPNEPAHTRLVAEKLAELKGLTINEIATVTTDNFFRLFSKATPILF